ncbi:MAG: hypothetical protein CM15mP4_0630 [Candidatus Neomarinimicrobiota bacterium]|nr:MAG: hypothetical protein CM15mP4_0630 [Candidatus Neomarinimicrobiota bacterium]
MEKKVYLAMGVTETSVFFWSYADLVFFGLLFAQILDGTYVPGPPNKTIPDWFFLIMMFLQLCNRFFFLFIAYNFNKLLLLQCWVPFHILLDFPFPPKNIFRQKTFILY